MTPPLPTRKSKPLSKLDSGEHGPRSSGVPSTVVRHRGYGIWNMKGRSWLYTQPKWNNWKPIDVVCPTKAACNRIIKSDLVHEKDYEVREYP